MNTHFFLFLVLITIISSGCGQTKSPKSDLYTESQIEDDFLITNLDLLGKTWGFLKYHHPEVGQGEYDWDAELFQFLRELMNVIATRQSDKFILRWIETYGEYPVGKSCKGTTTSADQTPGRSWQ